MIIDCISDLHGHYPKLEGGDLLIVAGDLTAHSGEYEIDEFSEWLESLNYRRIVVIAGNHDWYCEKFPDTLFGIDNVEYLCDSGTEFQYLKIWGSPWTKTFEGMNPKCKAFTCDTEEELSEKWALIPDDVDILITHGPPFTVLDKTERGEHVGSTSLITHHIERLRPKLFVFGHIHEAYGQDGPFMWNDTRYVNCSHVNERYQPVNKPIRILL